MANGQSKAGVVFAVSVILIMAAAVGIALNVPLSKAVKLPQVPAGGPAHQVNITLWADAIGWNYNHGQVNPAIVIPPGTLIHFTVIEEDNQPHTLTVAPGSQESATHATLLSQADITTTPGHVSHSSAYFTSTGEWTYWCTVHPQTMVGQLYVNSSAPVPTNNTTSSVSYTHWKNMTLDLNNSLLKSNGVTYPDIYIKNSTFLNLTVSDPSAAAYSLNFSYGPAVNASNSTSLINMTNSTDSGGHYFVTPGVYSYWNYYNTSRHGLIYVYTSLKNTTLYASYNGWNYSKGTVNPTLSFGLFTLVNFTLVNYDNLSHGFVINPGNAVNTSYPPAANLTPGTNSTSVMVFFYVSGNYTYWDSYHPSTSVGLILVSGNGTSSGGIFPLLTGYTANGNSDISVDNIHASDGFTARMEI